MSKDSRTYKSIKNSTISLLFVSFNLLLQFFSRKIFIESLGEEILGLNSTLGNILQLLNLAELGIGGAVGFTLYKPLYNQNWDDINEIVTLQSLIYKRIASIIIIGACIVMCFFPIIFDKMELPLWYAYTSFIVLLSGALLGYYFNYKQIVLSADQKDYIITYSYRSFLLLKIILQIITLSIFPYPYIWWLVIEFAFSIIGSLSLTRSIRKKYPQLKIISTSYHYLKSKHSVLILKIKQIFFHQIASVALVNTSPLIIYAFANLEMVTKYMNYMIVINGLTTLFRAVFRNLSPGVGNLISSNNRDNILSVFREIYSLVFIIVASITILCYYMTSSFISLWLGQSFILSNTILFLLCSILFISLNRSTIDSFLQGYGLVKDIWAPITETILNMGLSICFGLRWGLSGILLGVLISLIIIVCGWKPIFLFKGGFKTKIDGFIILNLKLIVPTIFNILLFGYLNSKFGLYNNINSFITFILLGALGMIINITTFFGLGQIIYRQELKSIISRIKTIFIK